MHTGALLLMEQIAVRRVHAEQSERGLLDQVKDCSYLWMMIDVTGTELQDMCKVKEEEKRLETSYKPKVNE